MLNSFLCTLILLVGGSTSFALSCDAERAEYLKLNRPLLVTNLTEARRYPSLERPATDAIHHFVVEWLLKQLNSSTVVHPGEIAASIRCLQSLVPEYAAGAANGITNAPIAFTLEGGDSAMAVVYEVYRGGAGAPSTRPYFEVFHKIGIGWTLDGAQGGGFVGATFFVVQVAAAKMGEQWFLLSGNTIGDSGTRLHLQLLAYDGRSLRAIWERAGLVRTTLAGTYSDHIVLAGDGKDEHGYFEYRQRLNVAPEGLKEAGIEKTYKGLAK